MGHVLTGIVQALGCRQRRQVVSTSSREIIISTPRDEGQWQGSRTWVSVSDVPPSTRRFGLQKFGLGSTFGDVTLAVFDLPSACICLCAHISRSSALFRSADCRQIKRLPRATSRPIWCAALIRQYWPIRFRYRDFHRCLRINSRPAPAKPTSSSPLGLGKSALRCCTLALVPRTPQTA